jgi:hypothetical protein
MIYLELDWFCMAEMEKLTEMRNKFFSFTHTPTKFIAHADNFKQVTAAEQPRNCEVTAAEFIIDASPSKFKFKVVEEYVSGQFFMI